MMILFFILFFVFLLIKMPVAFSMICSATLYALFNDISLKLLLTRAIAGPSSFCLLALCFFILSGNIMNNGGITEKIFGFCKKLVGWVPGGLGHANVVASIIFAGMSGAAVADAGGLGAIEVKAMVDDGYDESFAVSVTGASSIIGPIIPPSIPAVVFAVASGVSVGKLFLGGLVPGLLMGFMLMIMIYVISKKRNYPQSVLPSIKDLWRSFRKSFFALLTPVIILGGIITGIVTPTEASVVAVIYAVLLGLLTKDLKIKEIPRILDETALMTMSILLIVAAANSFGYILTTKQFPQSVANTFLAMITNKYVGLLIINILLLCVGMFMESLSALVILVPILMPIVTGLGVDPIHFGIIMILNLMIGMLTPPVGIVLYVLAGMTKNTFEQIARSILPFLAMNIVSLLIITFVPPIVTFLPNLVH